MTAQASIDTEISRILASDTTRELASQLKTFNSREIRIEEEILMKSAQINKLQNYLKDEISNIHAIVEENTRLKKEMEGYRRDIDAKNQ
jgi:peptidoglycan hydrolase CwlO-like protein